MNKYFDEFARYRNTMAGHIDHDAAERVLKRFGDLSGVVEVSDRTHQEVYWRMPYTAFMYAMVPEGVRLTDEETGQFYLEFGSRLGSLFSTLVVAFDNAIIWYITKERRGWR
ncbi:hypothetical protein ACFL6C_10165 [Myxococcota bacterium]